MTAPGQPPVIAQLRHPNRAGERPEVRVRQRNIDGVEHDRMPHFAPVGGYHVSRHRQPGGAAELSHHFPTGKALFSAARIFGIGQDILQPLAQRNRFIQQPGAVRVNGNARVRETFFQRAGGVDFLLAR